MKKNWKFATMALIAGVSLFATSCSSDEDPVNNPGDGGEDTYVLNSDITENVTLELENLIHLAEVFMLNREQLLLSSRELLS